MHRRTRLRLLPVALVATAVVLAGCGSSNSSSPSSDATLGLDSVKISGNLGVDPTVDISGQVNNPTTTTKVLIQGDGPTIEKDDAVFIHTVIADGYTQKTVASSYKDKQPQVVTLTSQVSPIFLNALVGKKIGSRVVVFTSADNVFGAQGNSSLGISTKDAVLIIFDLIAKPLDKPDGAAKPAPAWAPKLAKTKGVISSLDFSGTPKPDGTLKAAVVKTGTGDVVKNGQTIAVRYLVLVYGGKKPFDQNYNGALLSPQIGVGGVVPGWDKTLVGKKVGSEVIIAIPPKDGYGSKGSPDAGIKGTDTLYFVVDILGAA